MITGKTMPQQKNRFFCLIEMGKIFEDDKEGMAIMNKADYIYSSIIPKVMNEVETHFLSNTEFVKKSEDIFLSELKKYYLTD